MPPLRRLLLAFAFLVGFGTASAQAQTVTVLAAASLQNALDEAGAAFTRAGGPPVRFSYAGSSALARQIEQGAPADVFLSADSAWMDYVADRKLIATASRRDLLTNRLALIAPKDSKAKLAIGRNMPLAKALGGGRLAMAAPEVPAGKYGRAALASLGVWPSVQDKVASAENVRAALLYVSRGEAPLGIVYDTDARIDPKVRIVGLFPEGSHPRIVYPGAVLASSNNPAAQRFLTFLQGPQGRVIFRKYGFTTLR